MKILLLDDNENRIKDIEEIAHEYKSEVHSSHSLEDALTKLNRTKYDLVIIDLIVPEQYRNRALSESAGFELTKHLFETNDNTTKNTGVIVVSENLDKVKYLEDLNIYPISIIDTNFEYWQNKLRLVIDNYLLKIKPVDIAIITAVDVEFSAIYDDDWKMETKSGALTFYRKTFETKANNCVSAILVQAEDKGMVPAAMAMSKLFENYCPEKIFMTGIAAGNPQKTSFGDIIVATSSSDYGSGAITNANDGGLIFESEANIVKASDDLINIFRNYSKDKDICYNIRKNVNMPSYNTDISIKLGLMACGPLVVKSEKITEEYIRPHNKNYIGIDMESYAVYYACQKNHCKDFITIKSVSDHGDKNKNHDHQIYCSKLSAELLKYYIYNEL